MTIKRRESKRFFGLTPLITDTMTKERIKLQKFLTNPNPFQTMSFGAEFEADEDILRQSINNSEHDHSQSQSHCHSHSHGHSHSHSHGHSHSHRNHRHSNSKLSQFEHSRRNPSFSQNGGLDCSHRHCNFECNGNGNGNGNAYGNDKDPFYKSHGKCRGSDHNHNHSHNHSKEHSCTSDDDDDYSFLSDTSSIDDGKVGDSETHCSQCEQESRKRESRKQLAIAQREEYHVRVIRCITFSFIIVSAVSVCYLVYRLAKDFDRQDFESQYEAHVESIQNDVLSEIKYNKALMEQLGNSITSGIMATSQSPPFMTLPGFEVLGDFSDGLGGIIMTSFVPLVSNSQKLFWEDYSVSHQGWLKDSHDETIELNSTVRTQELFEPISDRVWIWENGERLPLEASVRDDGLIAPLWQNSPADPSTVNVDLFSVPGFANLYDIMMESDYKTVMSSGAPIGDLFDWIVAPEEQDVRKHEMEPHALLMEPLFDNFTQAAKSSAKHPVGLAMGLTSYKHLFERILPSGGSAYVVLTTSKASCGSNLTYLLDGPEAIFVGYHDLPELGDYQRIVQMGLDHYEVTVSLCLTNIAATDNDCNHTLHIFPTPAFKLSECSNNASVVTSLVAVAFIVTTFCFLIYERLVTRREKTKNAALEVVASLFPSGVQDEVLRGVQEGHHGTPETGNVIASFFPSTTIMFADIAGFTAWSSTREPEQVFRLLETVYGAMDQIAIRRGVFKVETVGDCYVAVCGLPEPRDDHAVVMARFARDCQLRMASLSRQLEVSLGPDTADLSFRIGMHSGPVTGGVLRGQNARFQLFGDTMNQASRMETTGVRDRIQMSTTTAQLLIDSGKAKWIEKRPEKVDVKGKGLQETYFLKEDSGSNISQSMTSKSSHGIDVERSNKERPRRNKRPSIESIEPVYKESHEQKMANKTQRLVTWNTEVLLRRVRSIVHHREHANCLDHSHNTGHIQISPKVVDQLQKHVRHIASMYRENPFHNYEHASHVTLSMEKMLSNVKSADASHCSDNASGEFTLNSLNAYTSDLTNDPLAQFAVVYSALIHDVDHSGCSNSQLVKENDMLAIQYNGKSPAENHSINLAWSTLMLPDYKELVECLCPTTAELERLKQLITDAVLATDIFDEDLIKNRNMRWEQVFGGQIYDPENIDKLRVMIVLDHLIQASDVAHTMQHWHVYIKWNERLFHEMSIAYQQGRLAKDPSEFWYEGELGFFDKYVIPLANKLRECGVFGVSCYEFLNYAETNRNEWETKGQRIVKEYAKRYQVETAAEGSRSPRRSPHRSPRPRRRSIDACNISSPPLSPPTRTLSLDGKEEAKASNNPAA